MTQTGYLLPSRVLILTPLSLPVSFQGMSMGMDG